MPRSWAISGVDVHLELEGTRVRAGLESALREAVRTGRLQAGSRLPSSRSLAADLGLARNTVAAAYAQLVAEGWLTARQGSGTLVADRPASVEAPAASPEATERRVRYDLRAGSPDVAAFPRTGWLAAARRALAVAPADALGYEHAGVAELREALAEYLARARGVHASPERIVVCSGFAQGLMLLCAALRAGGATSVATEAFGHRAHREAIAAAGLRSPAVRVDGGGAVVDEFRDADALLLTPAHQFPLGPALVADRRTLAVDWARASGGLIVEDDYDGEFRYDRLPVGAMQALAPEHVVYAGTASKSLAPGVRLGWLVLPARLVAAVVEARRLAGGPSAIEQLTLAELIRSGAYDRHVRRARLVYRRRRDRLVAALARSVPAVTVTGIAAGLHAVVELPAGSSEDELVTRARARGLAVEGLGTYRATGTHPPALVVGYGTPPEHAFSGAVARLCATLGDD